METKDLKIMLDKAEEKLSKLKEQLRVADCYQTSKIMHDIRNQITIVDFCKKELEKK